MPNAVSLSAQDGKLLFRVVSQIAESRISESDLEKLSELVGVELRRDFYLVAKSPCSNCGKELSFYDMVKTAIDQGTHTKEFFEKLFHSSETIVRRMSDSDKRVTCSQCATSNILSSGYFCMTYIMW